MDFWVETPAEGNQSFQSLHILHHSSAAVPYPTFRFSSARSVHPWGGLHLLPCYRGAGARRFLPYHSVFYGGKEKEELHRWNLKSRPQRQPVHLHPRPPLLRAAPGERWGRIAGSRQQASGPALAAPRRALVTVQSSLVSPRGSSSACIHSSQLGKLQFQAFNLLSISPTLAFTNPCQNHVGYVSNSGQSATNTVFNSSREANIWDFIKSLKTSQSWVVFGFSHHILKCGKYQIPVWAGHSPSKGVRVRMRRNTTFWWWQLTCTQVVSTSKNFPQL